MLARGWPKRKWVVERDASVTDPCAEVVSPVCHWEDIEMVQEVVRAIREAGARTDSSCGIHVHVGFGQHTPASLRRLVNIVDSGHHCYLGSAGYAPSMQALTVASRA